ncbi:MAG: phage major capsid protein [Burkholderiaceae bacterium]
MSDEHFAAFFKHANSDASATYNKIRIRTENKGGWQSLHNADLARARNSFATAARDLVEKAEMSEGRDEREQVGKAAEFLFAWVHDIDDHLNFQSQADAYSSNRGRTMHDTAGRRVRVLSPEQKLSAASGQAAPYGVGDVMAAMAGRAGTIDIRDAMSEGVDSAGGYTVPAILMPGWIDQMRAATSVIEAGARTVMIESDDVTMAKLTGDPVAAWRAEAGQVALSDATFGAVNFKPKSLAVIVKISRELLMDSINVGEVLQASLTTAFAQEVDRVALFGTGTAPEPRGVVNTAGVLATSMGANGAAITGLKDLGKVYEPLLTANVALAAIRSIMHPRTLMAFHSVYNADDDGSFWGGLSLTTSPPLITTKVPIDETEGTATNASSIISGDFTQLMLGMREYLRIQLLNEAFAGTGEIGFAAHMRLDVQLAQPTAFHRLTGIIPA